MQHTKQTSTTFHQQILSFLMNSRSGVTLLIVYDREDELVLIPFLQAIKEKC